MKDVSLKNITLSLKNLRGSGFNPKALFVVVLLCVFAMEIWVIKGSLSPVFGVQDQGLPIPSHGSAVRIDFKDYDAAVSRIQHAQDIDQNFQSSSSTTTISSTPANNPFIPVNITQNH